MRRALVLIFVTALVAGALAYLREPPWLADVESGFHQWETLPDGTRYRWIGGHASFFVPSASAAALIPLRATFDPGDPPVLVSIAIDDRPADALVLRDDAWQLRRIRLPPAGSRRLRRIDVRVDRLRPGNRGAQVGEVTILR